MKRWNWISRMIACTLALCLLPVAALAAVPIQTGDYIQMGYIRGDVPVLWYCIDAEDSNGPLMMSLQYLFGGVGEYAEALRIVGPLWESSAMRKSLNQDFTKKVNGNTYERSGGFLRKFSLSERRAMRLVPQYTLLNNFYRSLAVDPSAPAYPWPEEGTYLQDCPPAESGSWLKQLVSDVVFPLGIDQSKKALMYLEEIGSKDYQSPYYQMGRQVRSPKDGDMWSYTIAIATDGSVARTLCYSNAPFEPERPLNGYGSSVYPCFYLNQTTAYAKSGSGTEEDPYVVDTNCTFDDGRIIRIQGANLPYDTPVYEEQGEVMVPLRAIIEALGGSVTWDEATRTVAISCRGVEARVEVDSQKVLANGEEKWPQAVPQLRYDRTYIPFSYLDGVLGLQQPWTTGWEENGQLIELLYASEEQAADIPSTSTVTPAHE